MFYMGNCYDNVPTVIYCKISFNFLKKSETNNSEFLESIEEMFPLYHLHRDVLSNYQLI